MKQKSSSTVPVVLLTTLCLLAAAYLGVCSYKHIAAGLETRSWIETRGDLIQASIDEKYYPGQSSDDASYEYTFYLSYSYSVASDTEASKSFHATAFDVSDLRYPLQFQSYNMSRKGPGMYAYTKWVRRDMPYIKVWYNPNKPEESVVWQGPSMRAFALHALFLAFLVSAYSPLSAFLHAQFTWNSGTHSRYRARPSEREEPQTDQSVITILISSLLFNLFAAGIACMGFYLLGARLIEFANPETWIVLYSILVILTTMKMIFHMLKISSFVKSIGSIATLGWIVVICTVILGGMYSVRLSYNDSLLDYKPGTTTYINWLQSDRPYSIIQGSYALAGTESPPIEMVDPLLRHLDHERADVRKAVVFALSKTPSLDSQHYQRIKETVFDDDEAILLRKVSLLLRKNSLSEPERLELGSRLLQAKETPALAAFRMLRNHPDSIKELQERILAVLQDLTPGPAYAIGINLFLSFEAETPALRVALLKALQGNSQAASHAALRYLNQFPGLMQGSLKGEMLKELQRISDDSYGNRKELADGALQKGDGHGD